MPDQYREPVEETKAEKIVPLDNPEFKKEPPVFSPEPEKEKKPEESLVEETAPATPPSSSISIAPPPSAPNLSAAQAAAGLRGFEKNQQLKSLVDLAFEKGVHYATEVVKNLDNPYLLDEFHDILVDELHKKLVERGKLEEV